jgi:phosphoglycolate phosphatase-like HAD superfamily hydrolase
MIRLAIFDIDGTLTNTNAVDDSCFVHAVSQILNLDRTLLDWSEAPHITDSGLLSWLCQKHCGRRVQQHEIDATIQRFLHLLQEQLSVAPERFSAIAGAARVLPLLQEAGWHIAIATGGWNASARLKLQAIGLQPDDYVLASANDALTREEILQLALSRAEAHSDTRFNRIVSIGDGVWDVRAARNLAWPFIGIGTGTRAEKLRQAGAATVLPDLSDLAALQHALEHAEAPRTIGASVAIG